MYLMDIYRKFYPDINGYSFSSLHLMQFSSKLTIYSETKLVSADTRNSTLNPIRPQWIKTRYQQQQKAYKRKKMEQVSTECKMSQDRNKEVKDLLKLNE